MTWASDAHAPRFARCRECWWWKPPAGRNGHCTRGDADTRGPECLSFRDASERMATLWAFRNEDAGTR